MAGARTPLRSAGALHATGTLTPAGFTAHDDHAGSQVSHPMQPAGLSRRRLLGGLVLGATLLPLSACSLFGDDKAEPPPYPVPKPEGDAARIRLRWKNTSGSEAKTGFQPVVSGDSLWVVDTKGTVRRLSRRDGREAGSFRVRSEAIAGLAADDELVVLVNRDGTVLGLSPDGQERWQVRLDSEVVTAPILADSAVLVRTIEGKVLALERGGGSQRWNWQAPTALLNLWQSSPMVVDGDTVYVGLPNARLVALDLRFGVPRWDTAIASSLGATELERLIDIVGAPVMMGSDLCAVAYQGRVACVRTLDGELSWSRALSSASGMAGDHEDLVIVDAGEVIQLLRPGGGTVWRQDGYVRRGLSAPVIAPNKRLLFGDRFGNLSVLSMDDGSTLARIEIDDTAFATPPLVVDDTAYVQTLDGTVAAVALR